MTPRVFASTLLSGLLLLGLTACLPGPATPTPTGSSTGSASPTPSDTPSASPPASEAPVAAASIVVTGGTLSVFGADGSTLVSVDYEADAATVADRVAEALGVDPVITSTLGQNSGCDSDQTEYDFGGLLLRSPGFIGTTGEYQAVVTAAATAGGVVLETVAGQRVGAPQAAFLAAVGETVLLSEYPAYAGFPGGANYGFDIVNPEASEFEHIGALAAFVDDALESFNAPYYLYADC